MNGITIPEFQLSWWLLFAHVGLLLFIDFFVIHGKNKIPSRRKALMETLFFVLNAFAFGAATYYMYLHGWADNINGLTAGDSLIKYITGYLIELSLSVDNLFVIAIIFAGYKIPMAYQHRLLFLGILGAIVFRAILITVGLVLVRELHWIGIVFGLFLLYTAFRMLRKEHSERDSGRSFLARVFRIHDVLDGGRFTTVLDGKRVFTSMFGALLAVEFTDLLFALDSIPAVFAVTTDPFLVLSSNIYAILGLRSMYFFLAHMLERFQYLKYSVFSILIFVALKLITSLWIEIPEWFSLLFILLSLTLGVWVSLAKKNGESKQPGAD